MLSLAWMATTETGPRASRRRESSRRAILDAALALCREEGYAKLTVEGIAARAGVGKQTIYRWWPSKGAVLLEALDQEAAATVDHQDTGDVAADLRAIVATAVRFHADPEFGPHLAALIAETQQDPALAPALLDRFVRPRRAALLHVLRRAQASGQLPASLDPEAFMEIVFGALYHRLLLGSGPLDADYASFVADVVLGGATGAAGRPPSPPSPASAPPVAAVISFIDRINHADVDGMGRLMTEDHELRVFDEASLVGRDANIDGWRGYAGAYPVYCIHPHRIAERDRRVAVQGHTTGSHLGLPEAEERRLTLIWVAEVVEGALRSWTLVEDSADNRRRLGLDDLA